MMKRPFSLFTAILLGCLSLAGFSSSAFPMRCVSVGATGAVTITWSQAGLSAAAFQKYLVYHSTAAAGPFSPIDSIFIYNDTTTTHLSANANTSLAYYFVVFKSNNGSPDIFSDTIQAIHLTALNPPTGFAQLSWNATHAPLIPTNGLFYRIYREYPPGLFTLIDSVNASTASRPMTYSDLITICGDTIKYRIEVPDASGCVSVSNVEGNYFQDLQNPAQPAIDSVSVDAAGNVVIAWNVNPSPDTREYVINEQTGNVLTPIDTLFGIHSVSLNTGLSATSGSLNFRVNAIDSCGNASSYCPMHSTIFLTASFVRCTRSIVLNWSPYISWVNPVTYNILVSVNGGAETIAGNTASTTFNDTNIVSGASYCFRIRAVETATTRTSTSNKVCVTPGFPPPPAFTYIRKATVLSSGEVYVQAYVDSSASVSGYELLRADSAAGPFHSVNSVATSGTSQVIFIDRNVNTSAQSYYYLVVAIDSCGLHVKNSQISKTILLNVSANGNYTNDVTWDDYSTWLGGTDHYNVYRRVNGFLDPVPVAVILAPGTFHLTDEVINDGYSDGEFCYVIEAVEGAGNSYLFMDTSRSNEVCVKQDPIVFIPNAFHVGGDFNNVFHPENSFLSGKDYSFTIFDRWGEEIFTTDDPKAGWNGMTNQQWSQEGVYIYYLKAKKPDGEAIEKVGSVLLIR